MRLLALSDIHGNWRNLRNVMMSENCDAVLIAGDLSDYSGRADKVIEILSDFMKTSKATIYAVLGNIDDPKLLDELPTFDRFVLLHGRAVKASNYVVVGLSGSLHSPFHTYFELGDDEYRKLLNNLAGELKSFAMNRNLILLTHTPPYNTKVDLTYSGLHVGSESILEFIRTYKPIITICGHIHEGRGVDNIYDSLILNPGPLFKGFYAIINIEGSITYELKVIR